MYYLPPLYGKADSDMGKIMGGKYHTSNDLIILYHRGIGLFVGSMGLKSSIQTAGQEEMKLANTIISSSYMQTFVEVLST